MRPFLLALFAVMMATVPLARSAAAVSPQSVSTSAVNLAIDDAEDAIPSVEEIRAALTVFGAPTINDHDLPDNDPLWALFDEATRFVVVPSGDMNEVTFIVGAYIIDEGTDEHTDFVATTELLRTYATKRVGPAGSADAKITSNEDGFGANEAIDATLITRDGGADKNIMFIRLARFGKLVTFISADTNPKVSPVSDDLKLGLAFPFVTIAKLVADKSK